MKATATTKDGKRLEVTLAKNLSGEFSIPCTVSFNGVSVKGICSSDRVAINKVNIKKLLGITIPVSEAKIMLDSKIDIEYTINEALEYIRNNKIEFRFSTSEETGLKESLGFYINDEYIPYHMIAKANNITLEREEAEDLLLKNVNGTGNMVISIEDLKIEKINNEEIKRQKMINKAVETGEKQLINKISVECDGSVPECSTDIIYLWAMPNGTVKSERIHTY
ncbi:MAG TPA: hypothetical protein PLD55_12440 [bacterium]|nr:hypothetical protein [bacterium]